MIVADVSECGDVAGHAVIGWADHDHRLGGRMARQRGPQSLWRDAVLDVPRLVDLDGHDPDIQSGCQRERSLRLMGIRCDKDRVAWASNRRHHRVEALRRTAGDKPAEIGVPRLSSKLMGALQRVCTLRAIV